MRRTSSVRHVRVPILKLQEKKDKQSQLFYIQSDTFKNFWKTWIVKTFWDKINLQLPLHQNLPASLDLGMAPCKELKQF